MTLVLDQRSRVWKLNAEGPAGFLLHFLKDADESVIKKLQIESDFDSIVVRLSDEGLGTSN